MSGTRHPASFRDPSGFIFTSEGVLYRHLAPASRERYDGLMRSGLYEKLVDLGLLLPHDEEPDAARLSEGAYKVLRPQRLPFVSYPYEWCFSQLRDAALATLRIQGLALERGMSLRDASAYNIQFPGPRAVLIDTLSFEPYVEGQPWVAYRQFCQHFLAPLALMSHRDVRFGSMLRSCIDGIPLDFASDLLPRRTKLSPSLAPHVHMHARFQRAHADSGRGQTPRKDSTVSRRGLEGILASLESAIRGLRWEPGRGASEWGDYYDDTNYSDEAAQSKRSGVEELLRPLDPGLAFDLGANTGEFSRILSERGVYTVAFDVDPVAVERSYRRVAEKREEGLLPLRMDLTNPSPGLGWANAERESLEGRGPADLVLALALVHHLAISNNLPLLLVADYFARLGRELIVEFVPKYDSQVQRLLATREDIFPGYTQAGFEVAFETRFEIRERRPVAGSERTLYRMSRR